MRLLVASVARRMHSLHMPAGRRPQQPGVEIEMRSFVRSVLLVAALSTPLAALAYGNDEVQFDTRQPANCDCCAGGTHASHHVQKPAAAQATRSSTAQVTRSGATDKLQATNGGINGWPTSFDSP